jgi:hypothetical protein
MWWPWKKKPGSEEPAAELEEEAEESISLLPDVSSEIEAETKRITQTLSDCRELSRAAARDLEKTAAKASESARSTTKSYRTLRSMSDFQIPKEVVTAKAGGTK